MRRNRQMRTRINNRKKKLRTRQTKHKLLKRNKSTKINMSTRFRRCSQLTTSHSIRQRPTSMLAEKMTTRRTRRRKSPRSVSHFS